MLEVRLLGRFKLSLDGKPIELPSRPAQSLFAYLILHPGTEHRREKLAGLFWPDSSESNARNNLRQALWRVRKALGDEEGVEGAFFISDSFTIAFNSSVDYELDAGVLEKDLPERVSIEDLYEIVSLYEGELLPGFYEDWVVLKREHLQANFERKMQRLMERLVGEKRWHDVLEWGERWIALGQVPELAFRALIIAHGGLGDTSSVASVYQRCVDTLEAELGVEPSEETKITYKKLSSGEKCFMLYPFERDRAPAPSPTILFPEPQLPAFLDSGPNASEEKADVFVARQDELARLDEFLHEMLTGRGKVVFITGDAGSGKTALMREFVRRAQDAHPTLLATFGDCNALTGIGDPYLPFREALALLTGDLDARWTSGFLIRTQVERLWSNLPMAINGIVEDGPDLVNSFIHGASLMARGRAYNSESQGWLRPLEELVSRKMGELVLTSPEQKDLFSQYTRVLHTLARQRPLLLLLDDLQWIDLGSVSLLFHLGRKIGESRILIVGAYRPDEVAATRDGEPHPLEKVVAEFKRHFGDFQIDLGRDLEGEGRTFVDAFLDTEPNQLGEAFREALYRRTGGHPLFTIELLRAMEARQDILREEQGRWIESPHLDWERLPARVEGVIEERIGRLETNLQEILSVASVEGEEFTAEVVAGVLGLERKVVANDLSNELDKKHHLVLAQGTYRCSEERISLYRFRHTLFARHLYNKLDSVERASLHEEIGNLLEGLYGDQVDEVAVRLARHFTEAGVVDKAITYYERAGNRAKKLSADEDAISHFTKGIELLRTLPETEEHAQRELGMQISLGAPLITTKGYGAPEVQEAYARARELSLLVLEPSSLFPVIYGLRTFYLIRAEHNTAREIAEQLIALAEEEQSASFLLQAHEALGSTLFYLGEYPLAREHLEQGIALYDPQEHQAHAYLYGQDPGVACLSYLALTLWSMGFPDRALGRIEEAINLAREQGHPFSLALALDFAASFYVFCREEEPARKHAEEAINISEKHNFPLWRAMGMILLGWAFAKQGKAEMGIQHMSQGLDAWRATGASLGLPNFLGLLAEAHRKAGRIREGLSLITQGLEIIRMTGERMNEAELLRLQGELLREQGEDAAEVESLFRQALHVADEHSARGYELHIAMSLGRFLAEQGRDEEARAMVSKTVHSFGESAHTGDLKEARAYLESIPLESDNRRAK
jgi:predicted ATPase/DNA-binding SARP family transcriptional activator